MQLITYVDRPMSLQNKETFDVLINIPFKTFETYFIKFFSNRTLSASLVDLGEI